MLRLRGAKKPVGVTDPGSLDEGAAPSAGARGVVTTTRTEILRARARRLTWVLAALAATIVAAGLGVYTRVHAPTGQAPIALGFGVPGQMKVWFTGGAETLACFQVLTGLRINGVVSFPRRPPRWFRIAHRGTGMLALVLAAPVGIDCAEAFGFQMGSGRVALHAIAGFVFFGAFAAKVIAVQRRPRPPWLVPAAGATLFLALSAAWATSLGWPVSVY